MVSLSANDLERLRGAQEILLSPLEFADTVKWRSEANRELCELTGADKAMFFVPGQGAWSDELDLSAHVEYAAHFHRFDRGAELALDRGLLVASHPELYDYPEFLRSEWHNDFLARHGCFQTLGLTVELTGGTPPWSFLCLQRERKGADPFDGRVRSLLALAAPAFKAGIETVLRREAWIDAVSGALDRVGERLAVYGRDGRPLHRNRALREILEEEPRYARVVAAVAGVARAAASPRAGDPPIGTVRGERGPYRIHGTRVGRGFGAPVVVVAVDPDFPIPVSDERLVERYGLTPREIEIARRIAEGGRNDPIAVGLGISPHTVRRHTEAVLRKLGVASRAQVVDRITR